MASRRQSLEGLQLSSPFTTYMCLHHSEWFIHNLYPTNIHIFYLTEARCPYLTCGSWRVWNGGKLETSGSTATLSWTGPVRIWLLSRTIFWSVLQLATSDCSKLKSPSVTSLRLENGTIGMWKKAASQSAQEKHARFQYQSTVGQCAAQHKLGLQFDQVARAHGSLWAQNTIACYDLVQHTPSLPSLNAEWCQMSEYTYTEC